MQHDRIHPATTGPVRGPMASMSYRLAGRSQEPDRPQPLDSRHLRNGESLNGKIVSVVDKNLKGSVGSLNKMSGLTKLWCPEDRARLSAAFVGTCPPRLVHGHPRAGEKPVLEGVLTP